MNDYDRAYIWFVAGTVINCCSNNWIAAACGLLATSLGGVGMIVWREQAQ